MSNIKVFGGHAVIDRNLSVKQIRVAKMFLMDSIKNTEKRLKRKLCGTHFCIDDEYFWRNPSTGELCPSILIGWRGYLK